MLTVLYTRLVSSSSDEEKAALGLSSELHAFHKLSQYDKTNVLLTAFRGFALYSCGLPSDNIDLLDIPVQPDELELVDWHADFFWDILLEHQQQLYDRSFQHKRSQSAFDVMASFIGYETEGNTAPDMHETQPGLVTDNVYICKRFMLRRRVAVASEKLLNEEQIFGTHVVDGFTYSLQNAWTEWLRESTQQETCLKLYYLKISKRRRKLDIRLSNQENSENIINLDNLLPTPPDLFPMPLPCDNIRVDLLFAEESRFVNARLYQGTQEQEAYLISIQVALSWIDEQSYNNNTPHIDVDNTYTAVGHRLGQDVPYGGVEVDMLALNTDVSVRPCTRCTDGYG